MRTREALGWMAYAFLMGGLVGSLITLAATGNWYAK